MALLPCSQLSHIYGETGYCFDRISKKIASHSLLFTPYGGMYSFLCLKVEESASHVYNGIKPSLERLRGVHRHLEVFFFISCNQE